MTRSTRLQLQGLTPSATALAAARAPRSSSLWRPLALACALAVGGLSTATPALAQTSRTAVTAPQITGFDVQPTERLQPGAELAFTVWGTPGATATLQITGATRALALQETRAGVYEGTYTVSQRDNFGPDAPVRASLRRGQQVATAGLAEPLQQGWQPPAPVAATTAPVIQQFLVTHGGVDRRNNSRPTVLNLRAEGTPGARVWVVLPGAENRRIRLTEQSPGLYTANYTVGANDRLDGQADARAVMQIGDRRVEATLPHALAGMPLAGTSAARAAAAACSTCGTVVAVNRLEVQSDGTPVGTVAGGILGAVIGSQFGDGRGRTAAGVVGAVAGGAIGRQVDKRRNTHEEFEVVVRMSDGSQRSVNSATDPGLRQGDSVRITEGRVERTTS